MSATRVGIVLVSTRPGGTELSVLRLLRWIDRSRFEPHVCVLTDEGPLADEFRDADIPLTALGASGPLDRGRLERLRGWIADTKPAILHGYLYAANLLVRLWGHGAPGRRVVVSIRGIEQWRHPLHDVLERFVWTRADAVLANSDAAAAVMRGRFGSRVPIRVIHQGIEPLGCVARDRARQELGFGSGPIVLCVANLIRYKRHAELLQAFQRVRLGVPGARLLLVGTGPEEKRLRDAARRLGIADGVEFLGLRADLDNLYAASDVVVLASSEESLPNTLLEAGSAGRPVVATRVGGVPEIVVQGQTGFMVPQLESRPMADAVIQLLDHPEEAAAMGLAARARIESEFSMPREAQATEAFYQQLIEGRP